VAGGGADHQDLLRAIGDLRLALDVVDLLLDRGIAAGRMGGDADEAADARFDDHGDLDVGQVRGSKARARSAGIVVRVAGMHNRRQRIVTGSGGGGWSCAGPAVNTSV